MKEKEITSLVIHLMEYCKYITAHGKIDGLLHGI